MKITRGHLEDFGSFLPELGLDIILASLWPTLMNGGSKVKDFQTSCHLRCVCSDRKKFVENMPEWQKGLLSWAAGDHRYFQVLPLEYLQVLQGPLVHESSESE